MDTPRDDSALEDVAADRFEQTSALFAAQRTAFDAAPWTPYERRRAQLRSLRQAIRARAAQCADAAARDFGTRAQSETMLLELLPALLHIDHLLHNLRRWMKPSRRRTELLFKTNRAWVQYQPKGVVGIVASWNAPFYLTLGPLATAIAAGNRCLVKTSEYAPLSSRVLCELLADVFAATEVAVVEGGADCARHFCALPFNHIVFTGSSSIGRSVMRAAADNLTPVTLELGGKSPAVVSRSASLATAARRIVHGKISNGGQICVSPDHALVPREQVGAFVEHAAAAFADFAADFTQYTSMIDERSWRRMHALLDDAQAHGARVIRCGTKGTPDDGTGSARRFPLTIVTDVTPAMRIAREEIFGPILPVVAYDSFEDALEHVRKGERPLALYWFGTDRGEQARIVRDAHSGGVTLNDWGWHVLNHDLPFGGSGHSGMGTYHGVEGFRELSHAKSVFAERRGFPVELFHPPYGRWAHRLVVRWYLGAGAAQGAYGAQDGAGAAPAPAPSRTRI